MQGQHNQETGIPEAKVELFTHDGIFLGDAPMDSNGNYAIAWNTGGTSNEINGVLRVAYGHAGRFAFMFVTNPFNGAYQTSSTTFTWIHGTTWANPQTINRTAGVNSVANAYWAAWKNWMSLATSLRQWLSFSATAIFAFDTGNVTGCNAIGSCARPYYKNMSSGRPTWAPKQMTIVLDGSAATPFDPQNLTMHEMGHLADFVSAPSQGRVNWTGYDRDGDTTWSPASQEYTTSAMTEGLATYFATAALYAGTANAPRQCRVNGNGVAGVQHCWAGPTFFDIETRTGSCVTGEGRTMVNSLRFFWDLYDGWNDDDIDGELFHISDTFSTASCPSYPACYSTGELHDSWTSVNSQINWDTAVRHATERDRNGPAWFAGLFGTMTGASPAFVSALNCMGSL